ncbi:MAG: LysM peptidoglycan-binding domain-containing protein [Oscillospiraceae bacterium]|nr:LysM peptidoglycan-binding domain-containing protein [Oscillospiraceae bacterium]
MKKAVSLILALTLCVALAVPAFAADYGKLIINDDDGRNIVFDAAVLEKDKSIMIDYWGEVEPETANLITVKAGSNVQVSQVEGWEDRRAVVYEQGDGAYVIIDYMMSVPMPSGKVSEWFKEADGSVAGIDGTVKPVMLGFLANENGDYVSYFVIQDDSAPTTPAQTTTPATTAPATTAPAQTAKPAGSGSYTAQKYDTYGKLAVNYYGSYAYTAALQKANGYKALKAGAAVTLPDKLGNAARLAPAVADAGEKLYTVLAGDTLGTIAKAYYGNSAQYKAIFERNADRLKNANTIYEGQIIVLPAK